jgi:hypothetical protein
MNRRAKLILPAALCAAAFGWACGGGGGGGQPQLSATPEQRPDIDINKVINTGWVEAVPAADGKGRPASWGFAEREPKEITVVEQKVEGDRATFVVDIKTRSHPRDRRQMSLEGRLKLHMELRTEFIFREWRVVDVENISFKYTMLNPPPSPPDSPSPGASPAQSPGTNPTASPAPPLPPKPPAGSS